MCPPQSRGVVRLSTPGGQESNISSNFPHSPRFSHIFPQFFSIFFLNLGLWVGGPPTREGPGYTTASEAEKNAFLKLNLRDLVHTVWQHSIKNSFRINYWLHYRVSSFSHLSCFDAFARTCINLWPLKRGYLRRSSLPLRS